MRKKRFLDKQREESATLKRASGRVIRFAGKGSIAYAKKYASANLDQKDPFVSIETSVNDEAIEKKNLTIR